MNYYEHHIGDYLKDTAHLSMIEDAAYRRLIDVYYTRESPLPSDRKAVQKLARAQSKDERAAVDYVLDEFFELREGGWHQSRCDEEIAKYQEKAPRAQEKRENAKARQDKARARRRAMFDELACHGVTPPWDTTTAELETLLSRFQSPERHGPVTRDSTATQTPDPSHQTPGVLKRASTTEPDVARETDSGAPATPTAAGEVCRQLREAGIQGVNPSHPKLLALLDAGLTGDEIADIAREPASAGKGFAWILGAAEGRRHDAATVRRLPRASPSGVAQQNRDAIERAKAKILASEAAREAQHSSGDETHAR